MTLVLINMLYAIIVAKSGHIARDCFKKINNDSNNRYRKHNGNYVRKDTPDVNGFKNLRLFIS